MAMIPVLVRHTESGAIEVREMPYYGRVPAGVWVRLKNRVLELDREGFFYPLDTMDAYQTFFAMLEAKSMQLPELIRASAETYLSRTLDRAILKYHCKEVMPVREMYRMAADMMNDESNAEDEESAERRQGMSIQQLAEALPGVPRKKDRSALAARAIDKILDAANSPRIAQAFMAYIIANGDLDETAKLMQLSRSHFFSLWQGWLAEARRAAALIWIDKNILYR